MSTDSQVSSSLHGSLSDGRETTLLFGAFGQLRRPNRVLYLCPLHGDFHKRGGVEGLLRFHHLKPPFDGFLNIGNSFLVGLPLRKTAWKRWNFYHVIASFILFNYYMQFHTITLWTFEPLNETYHKYRFMSKSVS